MSGHMIFDRIAPERAEWRNGVPVTATKANRFIEVVEDEVVQNGATPPAGEPHPLNIVVPHGTLPVGHPGILA